MLYFSGWYDLWFDDACFTSLQPLSKLDRKQLDFNILYHICIFQADSSAKVSIVAKVHNNRPFGSLVLQKKVVLCFRKINSGAYIST